MSTIIRAADGFLHYRYMLLDKEGGELRRGEIPNSVKYISIGSIAKRAVEPWVDYMPFPMFPQIELRRFVRTPAVRDDHRIFIEEASPPNSVDDPHSK